MTEKEIFEHLYTVARTSKDPRGVGAACLVLNGEILASAASSDDGVRHAEEILLSDIHTVQSDTSLYATLEPCNTRRVGRGLPDCVSLIVAKGIKRVVFGAISPEQDSETRRKLAEAGVDCKQTEDKEIIAACADLFNGTVAEGQVNITLKPKD